MDPYIPSSGHVQRTQSLVGETVYIDRSVDLVLRDLSGALVSACKKGDVSEVCSLINRGAGDWYGESLIAACERGHTEVVQVLVKAGAKLEACGLDGQTPLIVACKHGHPDVVQVLIKAGANLEACGRYDQTPLFVACKHGHTETVHVLISAGAKLEARDEVRYSYPACSFEGGQTPLIVACDHGHTEVTKVLIKAGAKLDARDMYRRTPLSLACENGHTEVAKVIRSVSDQLLVLRLVVCDELALLFFFSLRELVSLLKCLRTGWGPPLELVMRRLNSKFWVMEADRWADLLKICRWANPTTINCKKCGSESEAITTSCNHVVCRSCTFEWLKENNTCPECGQDFGMVISVISGIVQQDSKRKAVKRERGDDFDDCEADSKLSKKRRVTEGGEECRLTLEDLQRRTGVSDSQLDAEVIEYDVHELAALFDQVESYLYNLRLTDGQQTDIKDLAFRHGTHIAMTKALKLWLQPNPLAATFRSLLNVLLDMKRGDVALNVFQYIASKVTD